MSRLRIWPDPVLSQVADPVTEFGAELAELIADLLDELYRSNGRALAAPQIGVLSRVFVMDAGWKDGIKAPRAFVNPEILRQANHIVVNEERCLSLPNQPRMIARPAWVEIGWQDSDGAPQRAAFNGFEAVAVQHDIDHLDGVTILNHPCAR